MSNIEDKYQKLTQIEHILVRPHMYVGTIDLIEDNMFIYENNKIIEKSIKYIPGLYKIFDEAIVNVADALTKDITINTVKINFDRTKNKITIFNNGQGIPIVMHKKEKMYVPEIIFGELLSSSSFTDKTRITGGLHGLGIKLAAIFSFEFKVEIADPKNKKQFKQIYKKNLSIKTKPLIESYDKPDGYVKISFIPDMKYFKLNEISDDFYALLKRRVYDLAMLLGKSVKTYIDNEKIPIKNIIDYVGLYTTNEKVICDCNSDRWKIVITPSNGKYKQVSFVNSINTNNGGKHVDYILSQIISLLKNKIKSKYKEIDIRDQIIKDQIFIFVVATIENPAFNSQTKEELITQPNSFGSICDISKNQTIVKKLFQLLNIDELAQMHLKMMESSALSKLSSKKKVIKGIDKLYDAYYAGSKKGSDCTLILTEGDSAKTMAISGLSALATDKVKGNDYYGVFPLKGKLLNVREAAKKQIVNNEEFVNLQKIIGLEINKIYNQDNVHELRYGSVILMMDADTDGSHIKGLFINMIDYFWPSLLKIEGFLKIFITPMIKAIPTIKTKKIIEFYSLSEYTKWKNKLSENDKYTIKYYKGLGTNTSEEAKEYFKNLDKHLINLKWDDKSDKSIKLAFTKELSDDRKEWLSHYDKNRVIDYTNKTLTYDDFINKELIHFSNHDNDRSIPSMVDGLKPSQRKVLYSGFKKNLVNDIKVAQFIGYVGEKTSYHHGEASLAKTIIGMAQNFIGSNNVNLFVPKGQFGTRINGGKDHASPRYIYTELNTLSRLIFDKNDDALLYYLDDDGFLIEPEYYVPIIPMILVNGCEGIGTGYSTYIPKFNPLDIIEILLDRLNGKRTKAILEPWYKDFKGKIEKKSDFIYNCKGNYTIIKNELIITELPIGTWTENYKSYLENTLLNDRLKGVISKIKNNSDDNKIEFIVKFKDINEIKINEIEKTFMLENKINLENMFLHDANGIIKKYISAIDIINEFYDIRLKFYDKRKKYLLAELEKEISILQSKLKFIEMVISDNTIFKLSNTDIIKLLDKKKLYKNADDKNNIESSEQTETTDKEIKSDDEDNYGQYDYLLKMRFDLFTKKNVMKLKDLLNKKNKVYNDLSKLSIKELWINDLNNLKTQI